jgi:hypothetical protein
MLQYVMPYGKRNGQATQRRANRQANRQPPRLSTRRVCRQMSHVRARACAAVLPRRRLLAAVDATLHSTTPPKSAAQR